MAKRGALSGSGVRPKRTSMSDVYLWLMPIGEDSSKHERRGMSLHLAVKDGHE